MADYVTTQQFDSFRVEEDRHHIENETAIAEIKNDIRGVRKTLFGNGDPGWDEMLRELWRDLQERKKVKDDAAKEQRAEKNKYIYFGITIVISNLFAIGVALTLAKLVP